MPHEFACTAGDCSFSITSDDDDEIVDHVRMHADEVHGREVEESDVLEGIVAH